MRILPAVSPVSRMATSAILASLAATACHTPSPNDLVLLDVPGRQRFALSTEDGIVALAADDLSSQVIHAIQYWRGRETHDDLQVIQRTEDLVLLKPKTARLTWSPFAVTEIEPGEDLYVQVLGEDFERLPQLLDARWYKDGARGDLIEIDEWDFDVDAFAARYAGAGVYAKRKGVYEIVGIVCGTVCTNPDAGFFEPDRLLPFIRVDAIAPVLPVTSNFFERGPRAFRPDFEHGLSPDGRETRRANK